MAFFYLSGMPDMYLYFTTFLAIMQWVLQKFPKSIRKYCGGAKSGRGRAPPYAYITKILRGYTRFFLT